MQLIEMVILFLELTLCIWKDDSSASFLSDQPVANEMMMATTTVLLLLVVLGNTDGFSCLLASILC